jgi:hypothetical protein
MGRHACSRLYPSAHAHTPRALRRQRWISPPAAGHSALLGICAQREAAIGIENIERGQQAAAGHARVGHASVGAVAVEADAALRRPPLAGDDGARRVAAAGSGGVRFIAAVANPYRDHFHSILLGFLKKLRSQSSESVFVSLKSLEIEIPGLTK